MRPIDKILQELEQDQNRGDEINSEILGAELRETIDFYFKIAEKLPRQDREKAYARIAAECYWSRGEMGRITGYDEAGSFDVFMAQKDAYYAKNKDKVAKIEEEVERIYDELSRKYMKDDTNKYIKPTEANIARTVYKTWKEDYIEEHYQGVEPILNGLLEWAARAEDKRKDDYFEYDFLVRAGVCVAKKRVMPKVLSDFIDCKDKKIVALLTTRISSCTTPKSIAITLIAMSKLGYINIDKINRRELYGVIRRMAYVKFNDNSINYHISQSLTKTMPVNMVTAIENEISVIANLLV